MKQHALRALEGLVVCATGLSALDRETIRLKAQKLGAGFSLDLTKDCTHLIAKSTSGSKYEYAVKWGLPVASMQWIEDCAAKSGMHDSCSVSIA
jgi:DNA replication regulator DPB11